MKITRPSMSSTSTLANPIFKLTRALHYCMRLECNHINQQRVLDTRFVRSLSCGTASWKPAGTKSDDTATKNQNRKDVRKEQGKGKKFFRSRTPWLGKRSSRQLFITSLVAMYVYPVRISNGSDIGEYGKWFCKYF